MASMTASKSAQSSKAAAESERGEAGGNPDSSQSAAEASEASDPARITNYSVEFAVDADGGLAATATVTVAFVTDAGAIFQVKLLSAVVPSDHT